MLDFQPQLAYFFLSFVLFHVHTQILRNGVSNCCFDSHSISYSQWLFLPFLLLDAIKLMHSYNSLSIQSAFGPFSPTVSKDTCGWMDPCVTWLYLGLHKFVVVAFGILHLLSCSCVCVREKNYVECTILVFICTFLVTDVYKHKRMDKNVNDCILYSPDLNQVCLIIICLFRYVVCRNLVCFISFELCIRKKNYYDDAIVGLSFSLVSFLASTFNIYLSAQ